MPSTFSFEWDTPAYKGKTSFNTGIFINGQFVEGSNKTTIEYVPLLKRRSYLIISQLRAVSSTLVCRVSFVHGISTDIAY